VATNAVADTTAVDLGGRYRLTRDLTETLARPLSPEDQTVQSMPDVSPTKWHRAHTTWFFETFLLAERDPGYRLYDPDFGFLFNSYYEAVGPRYDRPRRGVVSRPGAAEVGCYRRHVDDAMAGLLETPLEPATADLIDLGIHHEQQHQELLLMDIKHVLSCHPAQPAYLTLDPPTAADRNPPTAWVDHDGGLTDIGLGAAPFAFDNEGPRHTVLLPPFALASRPVTCGDWLEFIADGGYQRPELWLSDGWAAVQESDWGAPLYWCDEDGIWTVFTLGGRRPVHSAEPVSHVSYYEADAFARWADARLPSEFEWEAAARPEAPTDDALVLHPRPVGATAPLLGDVWQWTTSAYGPYPGFHPAAGAVGEYNGKFMVNQYVLRGGACLTPPGHIRPTYRNFFPASARWPVTGLRLAQDR